MGMLLVQGKRALAAQHSFQVRVHGISFSATSTFGPCSDHK